MKISTALCRLVDSLINVLRTSFNQIEDKTDNTVLQNVLGFIAMDCEKKRLFIEMALQFWGRQLENNKIERYVVRAVQHVPEDLVPY